ncbi:MAG: DUF3050 domain-containing protein [Bacteroidetes bacterium]|nr:DUF3050 domain-containing protein [Bacteroidota bacterium]
MTTIRIQQLKEAIAPVRDRLIAHPIYQAVQTPAALRRFMEYHVYAVWDFMSLLKELQRSLTCVRVPWVPVGSANTRYLINEIVLGEESDVDELGRRVSHFELYLRAMKEAGASTEAIERLVGGIAGGVDAGIAAEAPGDAVRKFLRFTFDTIDSGETFRVAAVFTFGREDLIPDLFLPLVQELSKEGVGGFDVFRYYLERHIEVDGEHHSQLAMEMLAELCGEDERKWAVAAEAARMALEARMILWDGVLEEIEAMSEVG